MTGVIRALRQTGYLFAMATPEPVPATVIPGHDVLALIAARGGRCTVAELKAVAEEAFGSRPVFGNCHGDVFDFEGLLAFLAGKGKLTRTGDEVFLGHVPACSGH
jgi:probable metal-binding protein